MIVSGGGVLYGLAADALHEFAHKHGIPVTETQAGKGALKWDDVLNVGGIGVTGGSSANELAQASDCVLAVGTRLQDFTIGSNSLFSQARLVAINANPFDVLKRNVLAVQADAALALRPCRRRWTTGRHRRNGPRTRIVSRTTGAIPPRT